MGLASLAPHTCPAGRRPGWLGFTGPLASNRRRPAAANRRRYTPAPHRSTLHVVSANPPQRRTRRLLLVRHGLPDYRGGKAGDEPPGPPLSDIGHLQAGQAAQIVAGCGAVVIYSSPLSRTLQTAEHLRRALGIPVRIDPGLREWHRTESMYDVSVRSARWLSRWYAGDEPIAIVVGHASPLLAIIRTALYLPHFGWWKRGRPDQHEVSTADRFEVSMASIYALTIEPAAITAELLFHPEPRIMDVRGRRWRRYLPRPVSMNGENGFMRRPNFGSLVGCGGARWHGLTIYGHQLQLSTDAPLGPGP